MTFQEQLRSFGACDEAAGWVGDRDMATAWLECKRGDWMLWLAAKAGVDRMLVTMAACACARTALVHVPAGELRPLQAIEAAEAWTRGEASIEDVRSAAYAANAAYAAAYSDHASASSAAYAAYTAAYSAHASAADAAYTAAYSADAAAYAAAYARTPSLGACADLVREHITAEMVEKAWVDQ